MTAPDLDRILVVGCSDGIGRALVRRLLAAGRDVTGVSRSRTPELDDDAQLVVDVVADDYRARLEALVARRGPFGVVVWCVGVGVALDPADLADETRTLRTNLLAASETAEVVLPPMVAAGRGHLVGLSSLADAGPNPGAPAYSASKAGLSSWLTALGLALRPRGVAVTNVRFGFVDTKMAQSPWKPFLIDADRAAAVVERALSTRPLQVSRPRIAAWIMQAASAVMALRVWTG